MTKLTKKDLLELLFLSLVSFVIATSFIFAVFSWAGIFTNHSMFTIGILWAFMGLSLILEWRK